MRRGLSIVTVLIVALQLACTCMLMAQEQPVPVQRSKNKVLLQGKVYYLHPVQKGETIYSLCRAYNVTENELVKENPDFAQGLKEGMVLKIPERMVVAEKPLPGDTSRFIFHIISRGETLFSLAKLYGITVEQIAEYNPEVRYSALQVNQVLKIPRKVLRTVPEQSVSNPVTEAGRSIGSNRYIVGRGETLYSLARQWNTTPEEIIRENGGAIWKGLIAGDTILIPQKPKGLYSFTDTVPPATPDTNLRVTMVQPAFLPDTCTCDSSDGVQIPKPVSIYLALPINVDLAIAEMNDTSRYFRINNPSQTAFSQESVLNNGWIEFYHGFLLGASRLKKSGIPIRISVGDFGSSPVLTGAMASDMDAFNPQAVISPASGRRLLSLGNYCQKRRIPLITISYPESNPDSIPLRFLSYTPSASLLLSKQAQWILDRNDSTVIVIHPADSLSVTTCKMLQELLPGRKVYEAVQNDTAIAEYSAYLSKTDTNLVVILSDREEYVGEILRNLILLARTYLFEVIGSPAWSHFNSLETAYFHQLNLRYFTPFLIDNQDIETRSFYKKFRETFGYFPSKISKSGIHYAMLGYDMACLTLSQIYRYGSSFINCFKTTGYGLLGEYSFLHETSCSNYQKKNFYLVQYWPDFSITTSALEVNETMR